MSTRFTIPRPPVLRTVRAGFGLAAWAAEQAVLLVQGPDYPVAPPPRELAARPTHDRAVPLDLKMTRLLDSALAQSTADGHARLFHHLLDQLVPDEARILSALSDGSVSPLVDVQPRTGTGGPRLTNAALIGRTANLAVPRLTPTYVTHLLALGLVETGPEDASLKTEYEILLAETDVLQAVTRASRGRLPARIARRTLRLSSLGASLWEATRPEPP